MKDPVAIKNLFGLGIDIRWYAIIIVGGLIIGLVTACLLARKRGYNSDLHIDLILYCIPLAIICARLYYVAFEWESYKDNLISIFYIWEGGIAIYGAVIGSVLAAIIFAKIKKVPFKDLVDCAICGLIIGQAIGRWGNWANQEAFGNLITDSSLQFFPYGVFIDRLLEWHQATFFYESMWDLLTFIVLLIHFHKSKIKGNTFVLYFVMYGCGRFFIEGLRTDSLWLIPGVIRVSQLVSVILVVLGIAHFIAVSIRNKKHPIVDKVYDGPYSLNYKKKTETEQSINEEETVNEAINEAASVEITENEISDTESDELQNTEADETLEDEMAEDPEFIAQLIKESLEEREKEINELDSSVDLSDDNLNESDNIEEKKE